MKKKSISLMMMTSFLFFILFGFQLAMADDDPDPTCDFTVNPGESIQPIINGAAEGDVICVELGTYTEDLTITKGLELVGLKASDGSNEDDIRPTIEGVAIVDAGDFPLAKPNINIQADHVSIHGFIIKSPEVAANEYSSGIVLTGRNIQIYDNYFVVATGDVSQAIQTWRQNNAPENFRDISGLRIYKNRFTHLEPMPDPPGLNAFEGIFINPQSDVIDFSDPASAVVIEKNRFSGALIRAITTQRSGTVISKNTIKTDWVPPAGLDTFPRGIQLSKAGEALPLPEADSADHQVLKNKIKDTGDADFYVGILVRDGVENSAIEKNKVTGALGVGIDLETSNGNSVEKNQIKFSGEDGLFVGGNDNKIIKNIIKNSGQYGIYLGPDSESNSLVKNKVKKSGEEDIFDEGDDNRFEKNICRTSDPKKICRKSKKK
jgi:parallel beta-helix repeat protein